MMYKVVLTKKAFVYNEAISGINSCLEAMQVSEYQLPLVSIPEN